MTQVQKYSLITDRYAQALIDIAKSGELSYEKITKDLGFIQETIDLSKDLNEFLINPLVSVEDKKEIINRVFASEIDGKMVNFLKVLVDKDRFMTFNEIIISYERILDEINNISRVKVTSAVELKDDAKAKLKEKLETKMKKTVTLDWDINPKIIAGLVIKMGDNIIDTSLKHKLEDLSKTITK